MTRVYFLNRYFHPDESATAQLLADLARGLASRGFEVHVICSRQLYGDASARLPAAEQIDGVFVHRLWTTTFGRRRLLGRAVDYVSFYSSCFLALILRLRAGDIVVAKTDPPLISIVAAVAVTLRRATLVNWLQDVFPEVASALGANPLPKRLSAWLRRARNWSLNAAAVNVVLGRRMRDHIRGEGIAEDKIVVIPNWAIVEGAPVEGAHPAAPGTSQLRRQLGFDERFVVGYSGNLGRAHDHMTLLGAAEALHGDDRFVFLMVGGGVNMDALRAATLNRGLGNVRFLPYQSRDTLSDSLAAADVHLVSLRPELEGLIVPSKLYGILAAARPVIFIGDAAGEVAQVIHDAACGVTVASGDSAALTVVLQGLALDPQHCAAMGARAADLSMREFLAANAVVRWADALQRARGISMRDRLEPKVRAKA